MRVSTTLRWSLIYVMGSGFEVAHTDSSVLASHPFLYPKGEHMTALSLMTVALLGAGFIGAIPSAHAQTLKKIGDGNKITVSYREAAVPFSYLLGSTKAVGFAVDLTEAIVDDVRKKLKKPILKWLMYP